MVILNVLDPVHVETNKEGKIQLNHYLSYEAVYWHSSRQGKKRKTYPVYMVETLSDDKHIFPMGFLPRAIAFLEKNDVPYKVTGGIDPVEYDRPGIKGITFRKDQKRLIKAALTHGRGVLQAPTGSGKSIVLLGIISAFKQEKILFLCHTLSLISQFRDELIKWRFDPMEIGTLSGKERTYGRIQLATIQTLSRMDPKEYISKYQVIIIDEGHHVSSYKGQYAKVLQRSLAGVRIAVTATMPYKPESEFALEGLIGPKLGELTLQEGAKIGILAKPIIKILEVPQDEDLELSTNYRKVYQLGIVDNLTRNMMIVMTAKQQAKKGRSVLVNVNRIDHGKILVALGAEWGLNSVFVRGSTDNDIRTQVKNALQDKKIKVVIASTVFREGINIPSLDCCINGASGKSSIATLQAIGRGLRRTKTKKEVLIVDFKDTSNKYLRKHFRAREKIYKENNWL